MTAGCDVTDSSLARTHPLGVAVGTVRIALQLVWVLFALVVFSAGGDLFAGLAISGVILLGLTGAAGLSWVNWYHFRFGVTGSDLVIVSGVLVKKRRVIPVSRVQGVDIRADLVSRILGLADVVVQTAGGGEAEARIPSIPLARAEQLRAELLHRDRAAEAAMRDEAPGTDGLDPTMRMSDMRGLVGGESQGVVVPTFEYVMPLPMLVLAGVTSNALVAAGVAIVAFGFEALELMGRSVTDVPVDGLDVAPLTAVAGGALALAVLAIATIVVVSRDYGFTARRAGSRLETEAGLLERRMTGLPVARIQAVRVEQSALRRVLGLASVHVDTAGFGGETDEQGVPIAPALLPLVRASEVRPLLHRLLPEAAEFATERPAPRRALRYYVLLPTLTAAAVVGTAGALAASAALELIPESWVTIAIPGLLAALLLVVCGATAASRVLRWRHAGFGADDRALVITSGALGLRRVRLPRSRIQAVSVRQSFFQRRAGLATLTATTVLGSAASDHRVEHIDASDAARIAEWYSPSSPGGSADAASPPSGSAEAVSP